MERTMGRAEFEQRELQRELLLVRAAAERAALEDRLDTLENRSGGGLVGLLLRGAGSARRSSLLGLAASGLRIARAQPWLVPAIASGAMRLARSRLLRWAVLTAVVAGTVWWLNRRSDSDAAPASSSDDGAPPPDSDYQ
jgi:hypothetical protein